MSRSSEQPGVRSGAQQQLLATLADDARRSLYARVVAEGSVAVNELSSKDRRRMDALARAGLVTVSDGSANDANAFGALLQPTQAAKGINRFVRDGRIETWPAKPDDRMAVMRWAAEHAIPKGEQLDERAVSERLSEIWRDPATLRRDLFDNGLIHRTQDGRSYWRD